MAVKQISRIQHRTGLSSELPTKLAQAELGYTHDTGEVFIGAGDNPRVAGRETYPYQNIKILTEFDVVKEITGDVYQNGPLTTMTVPDAGYSMKIIDVNPNVTATCGIFEYNLITSQWSITGSFTVQYHKVAGFSFQSGVVTSVGSTSGVTVTPSYDNDQKAILVNVNATLPSGQKARLSITGKHWVNTF